MGADDTTNGGSAGRFLRIEEKLDTLISHSSAFQLDAVQRLTRLEASADEARRRIEDAVNAAKEELRNDAVAARTKVAVDAGVARDVVTDEASTKTFIWMKAGIGASVGLGILGFALRMLGI